MTSQAYQTGVWFPLFVGLFICLFCTDNVFSAFVTVFCYRILHPILLFSKMRRFYEIGFFLRRKLSIRYIILKKIERTPSVDNTVVSLSFLKFSKPMHRAVWRLYTGVSQYTYAKVHSLKTGHISHNPKKHF